MFSILDTYLDNGLRILLRRIPNQRTVSCGVWVNQGVKDEDSSNNGISHLVEHMLFKTKSKMSNQSMEDHIAYINEVGGRFNASTTKDFTSFYFDGLSCDLEVLLSTLSFLVIDKDEINEKKLESEKEIVIREAEGYLNSSRQIAERLGQGLWGDISYGQLVIGKVDVIRGIKKEQIGELLSEAYIPENSVLVVVGGFEYDEALDYINKYFRHWHDKFKKDKEYLVQDKPGIYLNSSFGGDRSTISIGFQAYQFTDYRSRYIETIKDLLVAPGARLFNKIREEKGLVYQLLGFNTTLINAGNLGVAFSASNTNIKEILETTIEEIKKLKAYGVEENELEKIKKRKETELYLSVESSYNQLQTIGKSAIQGKIFSVEDNLRELKKITPEKINKVIDEVFVTDNLSLALLGTANIDELLPILEV